MISERARLLVEGLVSRLKPASAAKAGGIAFPPTPSPGIPQLAPVLRALTRRWRQYGEAVIDWTVSPHDDMLAGESKMDRYRGVGVSGLEVISEAMLLGRRTEFARVFDLPCGGGRLTRHLVKFFPEATVFVSDLEKQKQAFVESQFGAVGVDVPADFSMPSAQHYDLIFVGSLATHFGEAMFARMVGYAIGALAPQGILIVSTHGRYASATTRARPEEGRAVRQAIDGPFMRSGFGYVEFEHDRERYGMSYGASFSSPAWIMRLLEQYADIAILGFRERGWASYQDVFMVQKAGARPRRARPANSGTDP